MFCVPQARVLGEKGFPRSEQHLERDLDLLFGATLTDVDTLALLIPSVTF